MPRDHTMPFDVQPDLPATMDIQIPALAWQPTGAGWQRTYYLDGRQIPVEVREGADSLVFRFDAPPTTQTRLEQILADTFTVPVAALALTASPILSAIADEYRGVVVMGASPFEALVITILSQNRTGEIVRTVYPRLAARCHGITPETVAAVPVDELGELIRSAGPYKAPRLHQTAATIAEEGEAAFDAIVCGPDQKALDYLVSLPGVAHKTAACVLTFAGGCTSTLPVDTHLFRVVDRLGLARHDGRNTPANRDQLISTLLAYGPDLAPAHFLFLLLGRTTCVSGTPRCRDCFLAGLCPSMEPQP